MVVDQTPASSFVIFRLVPLSQLPLSVTSVAFGASRRNVTVRSGWISGERNGAGRTAFAAGGAVGGCCATSDAPIAKPIAATVADSRAYREMFIGTSLEPYSRSQRPRTSGRSREACRSVADTAGAPLSPVACHIPAVLRTGAIGWPQLPDL